MTRHFCAPLPSTFEDFCAFIEKSSCLPQGYLDSPYLYPLRRVWEHMGATGVKSVLLQDRVRDPDFFAEHQAYYLKQHRVISSLCARVHGFRTVLADGADDPIADLIDKAVGGDYAGFTTIRPLCTSPVAATILEPLPGQITPCADKFPVHIAGVTFEVKGTPFLQQDNSVGACAQASIWMALRTQRRRAGNSAFNTAELTLAATRYLMEDRVFPGRRGLTIGQMLQAIRFAGHEPCVIQIPRRANNDWPANPRYEPADLDAAKLAIEPYVESGLPVILCMSRPKGDEGHAVIAIGRTADGPPPQVAPNLVVPSSAGGHKFIIHNDSGGPYAELETRVPGDVDGWALDDVFSVIVPMPDGVTVTAAEAWVAATTTLERLIPPLAAGLGIQPTIQDGIIMRQFLMERHALRGHMHMSDAGAAALKRAARSVDLPQWVWVCEVHLQDEFAAHAPSRASLLVFDATSDLGPSDLPLIGHVNIGLIDDSKANLSITLLSQTVINPPSTRFALANDGDRVSKDDQLAELIRT